MMQRIARAYANGMMKALTGQTYDEYEQEEYKKSVQHQYADMLRLLFAKKSVVFPSINHVIDTVNSGMPLYQLILNRNSFMKDVLWAINQWNISLEAGEQASRYLHQKYN